MCVWEYNSCVTSWLLVAAALSGTHCEQILPRPSPSSMTVTPSDLMSTPAIFKFSGSATVYISVPELNYSSNPLNHNTDDVIILYNNSNIIANITCDLNMETSVAIQLSGIVQWSVAIVYYTLNNDFSRFSLLLLDKETTPEPCPSCSELSRLCIAEILNQTTSETCPSFSGLSELCTAEIFNQTASEPCPSCSGLSIAAIVGVGAGGVGAGGVAVVIIIIICCVIKKNMSR